MLDLVPFDPFPCHSLSQIFNSSIRLSHQISDPPTKAYVSTNYLQTSALNLSGNRMPLVDNCYKKKTNRNLKQ